jgi:uncharacterized protein
MPDYSPLPPRPVRSPLMFQSWKALTFIHWRYSPEAIRNLIPKELTLDVFDGSAWLGLTPFLVSNLRPRGFSALPWISRFPETNVRTYVRGPDGQPGIWFFTLEASRLPAVTGARLLYGLPYRWANMRIDASPNIVAYQSVRREASTAICVVVEDSILASDLENFLTARFRLYTQHLGRIAYADVDHIPWPLRNAKVASLKQNVIQSLGIPAPEGKPIAHHSRGVDVRIGRLQFA